jgi:Bacteriophage HK97-gp10, putative tail-component
LGRVDNSGAAKFLRDLQKQLPDRFAAALRQESEIEATECKKRTPVDTGALRASLHVEGPTRDGRRVFCEIVAGGPAAPYALTVHEDLEAHHPQGEAKFIERPLRESAPSMGERIAARIEKNRIGPAAGEAE